VKAIERAAARRLLDALRISRAFARAGCVTRAAFSVATGPPLGAGAGARQDHTQRERYDQPRDRRRASWEHPALRPLLATGFDPGCSHDALSAISRLVVALALGCGPGGRRRRRPAGGPVGDGEAAPSDTSALGRKALEILKASSSRLAAARSMRFTAWSPTRVEPPRPGPRLRDEVRGHAGADPDKLR